MKRTSIMSLLLVILFSCNGNSQQERAKATEPMTENETSVNFNTGSTPIPFSAKTTDGSTLNTANHKGKYWVFFVYSSTYLVKSDTYDLVAELNETHKKFGDKVLMIGLATGFSDDEKATKKLFDDAKFNFAQIDNTEGPEKVKQVNDNITCDPAKIIIDPQGKVVYHGCGGKTNTLDQKLDSLIKAQKL